MRQTAACGPEKTRQERMWEMITRLTYGNPMETSAVVRSVEEGDRLVHFSQEKDGTFTCPLDQDEVVYAL